ncbi:MAG: hypothetical protein JWL69_3188, partial [Phycisphaerales bacterium]|nr:hypothetical protein [Phycisphaerales bacterium]
MKPCRAMLLGVCAVLFASVTCFAEVKTVVDYNDKEHATKDFKFKSVPALSKTSAATKAKFSIVDGQRDDMGGDLDKLNDGKLPIEQDQPLENFFFAQNADGGRLGIDLGSVTGIKQVNTYSWHTDTRGPQVYKLYASDGTAKNFDAAPKRDTDPEKAGWKLLATVDTRPKTGDPGGQYGVSTSDSEGSLGKFRYFLFDINKTEGDDPFGNTFYSEIEIVGVNAAAAAPAEAPAPPAVFHTADGKYEFSIDSSQAPDLKDWADNTLAPVMLKWYPIIVEMLPSDDYTAPVKFTLVIENPGRGVAATGGTKIMCAAPWFRRNLKGEAVGAVVHEMVHVVQQYGRARRNNPDAVRPPGWLVEAMADYIRWFKYEPQSHGADRVRDPANAKYDSPYRVGANFLNFVTDKYDKEIVKQLNAAMRQGKYSDELWKKYTGKTADELGQEWKDGLIAQAAMPRKPQPDGLVALADARPAAEAEAGPLNTLTDDEKKAGWKLLFDGKSLDGWHTFKRKDVLPGWQVKDGILVCADPHNAGDLCTNDQYDWYELQLDYNISVGGNSGIIYHITDAGGAVWATGPEFQLLDNKEGKDPQKSGWLYALYKSEVDATKPAGQWNHIRLLLTPEKCEHDMNGVKYFEYVLGSDDFKQRVARSKFASMKDFAKSDIGYLALQGDHGQVSFRNIKIRPIE